MIRKAIRLSYPIASLLILWEVLSQSDLLPRELVPPFSQAVASLVDLARTGEIYTHTRASVFRAVMGLLIAVVIGVPLGAYMGWSRRVERFFNPLLVISYPIPKPALIPIFMLWLGIGDLSKIAAIAMGCLLPIVVTAYHGTKGVDKHLIWSARSMGADEGRIIRDIVMRATLPHLLTGIKIAIAVSFLLVVSAEMVAARTGLGFLIFLAMNASNYKVMLAGTIVVVALGFMFDALFGLYMRRALIWHESREEKRPA